MTTQRAMRDRMRRYHRHLKCKTCGALPGLPCWRMPAPHDWQGRVRSTNQHPHQGRKRTSERCGDTDQTSPLSGCNLPPKHGGEWHYNRQSQQWRAI